MKNTKDKINYAFFPEKEIQDNKRIQAIFRQTDIEVKKDPDSIKSLYCASLQIVFNHSILMKEGDKGVVCEGRNWSEYLADLIYEYGDIGCSRATEEIMREHAKYFSKKHGKGCWRTGR